MDYQRLQGESDKDLINRICSEKDNIGSWQDVADILNNLLGTRFTESKYRKNYKIYSEGYYDSQLQNIEKQNEEIENKLKELKKERIKIQTLNIERNRLDRKEARQELYYEQIGSLIETLPLLDFSPYGEYDNDYKEEYILTLADIHAGATFQSINNSYSLEIMQERFEELADRVEDFIKQHKCKKMYVVGLGDYIQGCIHLNDLRINDSTVTKATVQVSRVVAQFLNYISQFAEIEYYHIISSNHGQMRYLGTKASELMDEDMEYIIGHYIKDSLINNPHVKVNVPDEYKEYISIPITGWNIICMHGHQIKNINNILVDLSNKYDSNIDYLIIGHQHSMKSITGMERCTYDTEVLVAPSFVGSDPYADHILKGSKAAVAIYGFHEYEGHNETYKFVLN